MSLLLLNSYNFDIKHLYFNCNAHYICKKHILKSLQKFKKIVKRKKQMNENTSKINDFLFKERHFRTEALVLLEYFSAETWNIRGKCWSIFLSAISGIIQNIIQLWLCITSLPMISNWLWCQIGQLYF